jgi:hypothetical protein
MRTQGVPWRSLTIMGTLPAPEQQRRDREISVDGIIGDLRCVYCLSLQGIDRLYMYCICTILHNVSYYTRPEKHM